MHRAGLLYLFAFPVRDRREIGIAVDGLFAHVLSATEHEYRECDSNQRAQDGAERPGRGSVVVHRRLRSLAVKVTARAGFGVPAPARRGIAAALWRFAEAFNRPQIRRAQRVWRDVLTGRQ